MTRQEKREVEEFERGVDLGFELVAKQVAYKRAATEAEAEGLGDLVDQYETSTPDEEVSAEGLADFLDQYVD